MSVAVVSTDGAMGTDSVRYEFECPSCQERIIVDPSVQRELLDTGCVFCGESISSVDFELEFRPT